MGKRLVILGSEGMLGKFLSSAILGEESELILIDSAASEKSSSQDNYLNLDLLDAPKTLLSSIFQDATVIHLASYSTPNICENFPEQALDNNIKMTLRIVNVANECNAKLIFASSEWVYPERGTPIESLESEPISIRANTNFYTMTKQVGEWLILRYSKQFTILRFGIIYGGQKKEPSAIEAIVSRLANENFITVGNLNTARRFIHVKDLCQAILRVIEKDAPKNEIYNLAGQELVTLEAIVKQVESVLGKSIVIEQKDESPSIRNAISEKFYEEFEWRPSVSLESGVRELLALYSAEEKRKSN